MQVININTILNSYLMIFEVERDQEWQISIFPTNVLRYTNFTGNGPNINLFLQKSFRLINF